MWFATFSLLIPEHKITPDKIDDVICAEIPDRTIDPELHQIVISNVHGPCGSINPAWKMAAAVRATQSSIMLIPN